MSTVWIVEKAKAIELSAAGALMGDYAVRVAASMASFEKLLRFNRSHKPDAVLIDVEDSAWTTDALLAFCHGQLPQTPVLFLKEGGERACDKQVGEQVYSCLKPFDRLELSRFIGQLIHSSVRERQIRIKFRDIVLDCERLQLAVLPVGEAQSLPLKEAQILKLFLEHPGACLKREEIQKRLWTNIKITSRTIDSHVSRLRKRLAGAEAAIHSVYGGGYVLR